ncbi:MAG: hypothetical protein IJ763_09545 [Lachnospiraceae bacterium]|nr:hypothetical protein [Lachnospiraceae bacterium]
MKKKFNKAALVVSTFALAMGMLTACGKEEESTTTEAVQENTTEAKNDDEETTEAASEASAEGDTIEATLWTINYDSSVWSYDEEEDYSDSDTSSSIELAIPGDDDKNLVSVEVKASVTTPYDFRDKLYDREFDEYEYAENGAYDRTDIGGAEFISKESTYWGSDCIYYMSRIENANETIYINVVGDIENAAVSELLDGISFNITDIGNEDGPWYWEGEPINVGDLSASIGSYTIDGHQLVMDEPLITHDTFDFRIATTGDKVYILDKDEIFVYDYDGNELTYDTTYDLDDEYAEMQVTPDGTLMISAFMNPLIEWKDGEIITSYEDSDIKYVSMHPSGTWGVSWFTSSDCKKVEVSGDGNYTLSDLNFPEVNTIAHINVTDNYIFVCGSPAEGDGGHTIFVYDLNGSYVRSLTADTESIGLGSCTFVAESSNGFYAMDGNMRTVPYWDASGSYIGRLEDSDLFGTSYPWFCGSCMLDADTLLTVMTEERPDKSADEAVVFTIKGF